VNVEDGENRFEEAGVYFRGCIQVNVEDGDGQGGSGCRRLEFIFEGVSR